MTQHLAHRPPIAAADDQHALGARADEQRNVGDHLVIDALVALAEHDGVVVDQHAAEACGLDDLDGLKVAACGGQRLADAVAHTQHAALVLLEPVVAPVAHPTWSSTARITLRCGR